MRHRLHALGGVLFALALVAAACGGDADTADTADGAAATTAAEGATTTVAETTTTVVPELVSYVEPGPYAVGVTTLDLGDRQAEVWYPVDPADVAGQQTEVFDSLSVFPESLQPLIPAELSGEVDTGAYRAAPVAEDAEPAGVVVYSHGFGGYRQTSTDYTTHIASYGYVVVSADHLERGIAAQATGTLGGGTPDQDVSDVERALAALAEDPSVGGIVDLDRVVMTGLSAGAGTAARAANLDGVDGLVSIAGGLPVTTEPGETGIRFVTTEGVPNGTYSLEITEVTPTALVVVADGAATTVPLDDPVVPLAGGTATLVPAEDAALAPGTLTVTVAVPDTPALVVIGELDSVVPPERSRSLYEELPNEKWLVEIAGAGHASTTDACTRIRALGGLQVLVPLIGEAQVARGENGCTDAYADPAAVQDLVGHYSVAFIRHVLDGEGTEALGPEAVALVPGLALSDHRAD